MAKLDVAPEFYGSYTCKHEGKPHVFIVMEYMTEGTLMDYLNDNKLSKELKDELDKKIKIMHSHGIIHRDLHNQNILLTKKKDKLHIYIADFGKSITIENQIEDMKMDNKPLGRMRFNRSFDADAIAFEELINKYITE